MNTQATLARDGIQRTVLPNGLRVVTAPRPDRPLAAVKLFFNVGSRHDGAHPGISHFLEHLLFNNPASGPVRAVFDAVESAGGELNAVTTRDYSALQAVVLAGEEERVVEAFGGLMATDGFDSDFVERERRVILEEIKQSLDSYQVVWDLFLQALWDSHSLAHPITGTVESVSAITTDDLSAHWQRYLAANRIVLAAAGRVDHGRLVQILDRQLRHLAPGALILDGNASSAPSRRAFLQRNSHQSHLVLGMEGVGLSDPRRYALRLLDVALGRGANSRLHQRLRGESSLVYAVSSVTMSYADRGYLAAYTACSPENVNAVCGRILDELEDLRTRGMGESELSRAKAAYRGALALSFETMLSLAGIIGIEELLHRVVPFEESLARVSEVSVDEVRAVAADVLNLDGYAVALAGRPLDG